MQDVSLLLSITVALTAAFVGGLITQRLRLSPIVGYVLAGTLVGPYTPGFVVDQELAAQMAEIGIILLMFGVGLRFRLEDLWQVRSLSLPGALAQSLLTTAATAVLVAHLGWGWGTGLVLGVALSVSSTVVMTRVLSDEGLLETPAGHVAVGWTIVEDLITVVALVLLPALAGGELQREWGKLLGSVGLALGKVALIATVLVLVGRKAVPRLLLAVARTRSPELFTLVVLVVVLGIATVSSSFFGVSLALGAFLAGIVVGHSRVSVQAASDALPLRDAFSVLFFTSIGMLFEPRFVLERPGLLLACLGVVLILKPCGGLLVSFALGASATTMLTVALCLGQIGEFSFILGELGRSSGILAGEGYSALVATALLSISVNPLLVRAIRPLEAALRRRPGIWRAINWRSEVRAVRASASLEPAEHKGELVIVGYGPVGRNIHRIAQDFGIQAVIVETNVETVIELVENDCPAIFGDGSRREVLVAAGITRAKYLIVTIPDLLTRISIITTARIEAPEIEIMTRARYLQERVILEESGANIVCFEETEAAVSLATVLLEKIGSSPEAISAEVARIRRELEVGSP